MAPPFVLSGHNIDPLLTPVYRRAAVGNALNLQPHNLVVNVAVRSGLSPGGSAWGTNPGFLFDGFSGIFNRNYKTGVLNAGAIARPASPAFPEQSGEIILDGTQIFTFSCPAGITNTLSVVPTGSVAGWTNPNPAIGGLSAVKNIAPEEWVSESSPFYNGGSYGKRYTGTTGANMSVSGPAVNVWQDDAGLLQAFLVVNSGVGVLTDLLVGNYQGSVTIEARDSLDTSITDGPEVFGVDLNITLLP